MTTIADKLNPESRQKLENVQENAVKNDKKRMHFLFQKLERMMADRKVKYQKNQGRIIEIVIDGKSYIPTVNYGNMKLFEAREIQNKHKTLIDGEKFFPGIND